MCCWAGFEWDEVNHCTAGTEREREREKKKSNPKPPAPSFTKSSCHLCNGTIMGPVGVYCDLSWLWQMQRQIDLHVELSGGCFVFLFLFSFFYKGSERVCSTWQWGEMSLPSSAREPRGTSGQSRFRPTFKHPALSRCVRLPLESRSPCWKDSNQTSWP